MPEKILYYEEDGLQIFHEDNMFLLRDSLREESIKLIYCDVLYNTGKKFEDYNDDLGSPEEAVEWYRPRIEGMKRVLAHNGSIFIHCNWRMDSYLRILMDDIFGANCFRNRIYRQHSGTRGFYSNFDSQIDVILYYVKNPKDFVFHELHSDKPRIVPLFENGYYFGRDDIRYCDSIRIDLRDQNKHWLVTSEQFYRMVENGEVKIIDNLPYRFSTVVPIGNLWNEPEMLDTYPRTNTADVILLLTFSWVEELLL